MEPSKIDLKNLTPDQKSKLKKANAKGCIVLALAGLLIIILFRWGCSSEDVVYTKEQQDSIYAADKSTIAQLKAEAFIKDKLKSPASADFDWGSTNVWYLKDSTFMVKGAVDSQNSFGAMMRTRYEAKVQQLDEENWTVLSYNFYE